MFLLQEVTEVIQEVMAVTVKEDMEGMAKEDTEVTAKEGMVDMDMVMDIIIMVIEDMVMGVMVVLDKEGYITVLEEGKTKKK